MRESGDTTASTSSECRGELAAGPAAGSIRYDNFNLPAETGQAIGQFPLGDPAEAAAEESRTR